MIRKNAIKISILLSAAFFLLTGTSFCLFPGGGAQNMDSETIVEVFAARISLSEADTYSGVNAQTGAYQGEAQPSESDTYY